MNFMQNSPRILRKKKAGAGELPVLNAGLQGEAAELGAAVVVGSSSKLFKIHAFVIFEIALEP